MMRARCRKRTRVLQGEDEQRLGRHGVCNPTSLVSGGWPEQGVLEVSNLVMRYRSGLTPSLKGVSLAVEPGEKVGNLRRLRCCTFVSYFVVCRTVFAV